MTKTSNAEPVAGALVGANSLGAIEAAEPRVALATTTDTVAVIGAIIHALHHAAVVRDLVANRTKALAQPTHADPRAIVRALSGLAGLAREARVTHTGSVAVARPMAVALALAGLGAAVDSSPAVVAPTHAVGQAFALVRALIGAPALLARLAAEAFEAAARAVEALAVTAAVQDTLHKLTTFALESFGAFTLPVVSAQAMEGAVQRAGRLTAVVALPTRVTNAPHLRASPVARAHGRAKLDLARQPLVPWVAEAHSEGTPAIAMAIVSARRASAVLPTVAGIAAANTLGGALATARAVERAPLGSARRPRVALLALTHSSSAEAVARAVVQALDVFLSVGRLKALRRLGVENSGLGEIGAILALAQLDLGLEVGGGEGLLRNHRVNLEQRDGSGSGRASDPRRR